MIMDVYRAQTGMRLIEMKHPFRSVCAALLCIFVCAQSVSALGNATVRIPASANRLHLPEMPDTTGLHTYVENDGKYAYLDADFELYFDDAVDFAAVDWVNMMEPVEVSEDGTARASKIGHSWQQHGVVARKDGVSASYSNSGELTAVWISNQEDYFSSGQQDAWTTIYWRCTPIHTECDGIVPTWFVSNVTVAYPYGEEIRSVSVDYRNNRKNNLYGYTVVFAVSETELYSIRYDEYDRFVRGYYHDGTRTLEYACDMERGKWQWQDTETGKVIYSARLREPSTFKSPRVR